MIKAILNTIDFIKERMDSNILSTDAYFNSIYGGGK